MLNIQDNEETLETIYSIAKSDRSNGRLLQEKTTKEETI